MSDKMLKILAINSLFFLLCLCGISNFLVSQNHEASANSEDALPSEGDSQNGLSSSSPGSDSSSASGEDILQQNNAIPFDTEKLGDTYIRFSISGVDYSRIRMTEDYMNRTLRIKVTGLTEQAFSKKDIERIWKNSYRYGKTRPKDKEDLINKLKITYTYHPSDFTYDAVITLRTKKLYAPLLMTGSTYCYLVLQRPKDVYDKIVVIDPGHGGTDTGTYSRDLACIEPVYTLAISRELKMLLDDSSIKAYYTRMEDIDVSKKDRVSLANQLEADFLISIHCNGAQGIDLTANGMETLYTREQKGTSFSVSNHTLASIFLEELTDATGRRKRGTIFRDNLYLLNHSKVPATILEVGFMSNDQDMKYLNKGKNLEQIAQGIYNGILKAYEKKEQN